MPTSLFSPIPAILDEIERINPKRMIDLGIGFGKYGVLCRELLDARYGRCRPDQWEHEIVGIEIFEAYQNPCWDLYSRVEIGDFRSPMAAGWPLVLMIDSLEHVEQVEGDALLAQLVAANEHVIVSVPIEPMPQGSMFGNEHEAHRRQFTGREFDQHFGPPTAKVLYAGSVLAVSIRGGG